MKRLFGFLFMLITFILWQSTNVYAETTNEYYLHEESFSTDYELKGLFATCESQFHVGEWNVKDAKFTMYYTATSMIREEISDFTVYLNSQPIYSGRIPLSYGEVQSLDIIINPEYLQEGSNTIQIESYIRTNDEDACKDDVSSASWMVVMKNSTVSINYQTKVECKSVKDIYKQLSSIEGLENNQSTLCVPNNVSDAEITTAGLALSGMSANATLFYENMGLMEITSTADLQGKKYVLMISEYENLLPDIKLLLSTEQMAEVKEDAIVTFVKFNDEVDILLVTGGNPQALKNAGRLLGNRNYVEQTKANWRKVTADENVMSDTDDTISGKLTETGVYVKGPFKQTASLFVETAANRTIAAGSEITLDLKYADNLDFRRSLVTVYINDIPIGSKKLMQENSNDDTFTVSIPNNLNIVGSFTINVTFDLEIPDLECTLRRQDMPWAYISNESMIDLQTETVPFLMFDYYPTPFIADGHLNQMVVVLPVQIGDADLAVFKEVMLALGRYQKENTGELRVCRASDMGDLSTSNIISIGKYANNPIAQQINNQLYFKFSPKGTTITSNEKMQIEPNWGSTLGTSQTLYSPYSSDKYALLIISGVRDEGMLYAVEYLGKIEKNWQMYGDGFVADNENIYCARFKEDNSKDIGLVSKMQKQTDALTLLFVGACTLFLLIISLILLVIKYKRKRG